MLRKTDDGSLTLYNDKYNELYHSEEGALLESRSLYIEGSGFSKLCLREKGLYDIPIKICDVGLGLGYNAFCTLKEWHDGPGSFNLELFSLENDEKLFEVLRSGKASWQSSWTASDLAFMTGFKQKDETCFEKEIIHPLSGKKATWFVFLGDAVFVVKERERFLKGLDFIWQDAFSPNSCPELWSKKWFQLLSGLSSKDTCLMTYSVAKVVKDVLEKCDWSFEKINTVTRKKSWLKAKKL